ncbi:unnamed protein product [Didymodactylos carnosus]|uniref:Uncharacterized protein n=1 Tax=Didymodactylos carnosus TaxID=1234261 RepID=A0A815EFT7_9BILA|nr:unnamed protein product [Didymodactylos carnosus]CAF1616137.1 unnamed protein product [Didymodactylos carnosus]CAF4154518.1 unnamed protein product [Didymodactylos carnosus]CAF4432738.1 unnamed protein product [Didymodactylos carnosus]
MFVGDGASNMKTASAAMIYEKNWCLGHLLNLSIHNGLGLWVRKSNEKKKKKENQAQTYDRDGGSSEVSEGEENEEASMDTSSDNDGDGTDIDNDDDGEEQNSHILEFVTESEEESQSDDKTTGNNYSSEYNGDQSSCRRCIE